MAKSYVDYDKPTKGDSVKQWFKLFGLSIVGGIVGALPYIVLWLVFNADCLISMILSGAGSLVFMMYIGKVEKLRWHDHLSCVLGSVVSVIISYYVLILSYFAPEFEPDGLTNPSLFTKARIIIENSKLDRITSAGLVTDNGAFSIYTEFFFGLLFAIIGLYVAFLFVTFGGKKKSKGKKK